MAASSHSVWPGPGVFPGLPFGLSVNINGLYGSSAAFTSPGSREAADRVVGDLDRGTHAKFMKHAGCESQTSISCTRSNESMCSVPFARLAIVVVDGLMCGPDVSSLQAAVSHACLDCHDVSLMKNCTSHCVMP
jgi:hypothetical protein